MGNLSSYADLPIFEYNIIFENIDNLYTAGGMICSMWMWFTVIVVLALVLTEEQFQWKHTVITVVYCGILLFCYQKTEAHSLLSWLLILPGAGQIDFRKLIKVDVLISTVLTAVTILCSLAGIIDNLAWSMGNGKVRMAFGFIYSTDFAAHIFFLMLGWWYLRREKANWKDSIFWLAAGGLVWKFSIARNSAVLITLGAVLMLYCHWTERTAVLEKKVLGYAPLLCAAGVSGLSIFYSQDIPWMMQLDRWFSTRLSLAKRAINIYGFSLWGKEIPMIGNGSKTSSSELYYYIDSGYLQVGLLYGVVLLAIVLCLLTWICQKAAEQNQRILLWIVALACVHGMIEQHLFELEYFPFFLAAFANLKEKGQRELLHGKEK